MKTRPNTCDTLITNLRALMKAGGMKLPDLASKSGVSLRMVNYILSKERKPTIEITEALAKAFNLNGWQLIIPGLPVELAKSGKLNTLVKNYAGSSEAGREYIDRVAAQEARYKIGNDEK